MGNEGRTGVADGIHAHSEIRNRVAGRWVANPELWNNTFGYGETYSTALVPSTWASHNSGYQKNDLSDQKLWDDREKDYLQHGSKYMNMFEFFMKNYQYAPPNVLDRYRTGIKNGGLGYK